jgi:hypothetical protein
MIEGVKTNVTQFYEDDWKDQTPLPTLLTTLSIDLTNIANPPPPSLPPIQLYEHLFNPRISDQLPEPTLVDELAEYTAIRVENVDNVLEWWRSQRVRWPNLAQMALDLFSIPAIAAECERVFSQTKLFITDQRNRLSDDIVEAVECLKHWYKAERFT